MESQDHNVSVAVLFTQLIQPAIMDVCRHDCVSQDKQNQNKDDYQKSSFQGYNGICGRY
jgi:hypothetical protein